MTEEKNLKILPAVILENITPIPFTKIIVNTNDNIDKILRGIKFKRDEFLNVFVSLAEDVDGKQPHRVGVIGNIRKISPTNVEMLLENKAIIVRLMDRNGMLQATVEECSNAIMKKEEELDPVLAEVIRRQLKEVIEIWITEYNINPIIQKEIEYLFLNKKLSVIELMDKLIVKIPLDKNIKQTYLEYSSINPKFELMLKMIDMETKIAKLNRHIANRVRQNLDKHNKEFHLREQLKVINEELGGDTEETEYDEFISRLKLLDASKEIKDKIEKEIKRFKKSSGNAAESNVSRSYINTLLDIPWEKMSEDIEDVSVVQESLDKDHYGLKKVKERVVEALAVRNITAKSNSNILCLVGPPGTGKTSIANSIARAMKKECVRIALGGVRDVAELRGHRRTYVGAIPGRIINGLIDAKVKNPIMILDEIDKISADYRGDCGAALLEILDAEQNSKFVDHYVELPVDLSEVLFIATANDLSQISQPLLDRMEIIELSSYTENEKLHIAKEHLLPKQLEKHGLTKKQLKVNDKALLSIINEYTKEAGVRTLERKIATICRKVVRNLYDDGLLKEELITVKNTNIEDYLGKDKIRMPKVIHTPSVGVIHGLAWTSVGGTVLEIETNTMPGSAGIILTGQMGDVMKESARIALSFVRSILKDFQDDYFDKNTIHIHIPAGAVPKDGPSAGITMATAIYSALTGKRIDGTVAMTGEITLRGLVMPIGGLKEKLVAARTAGIKTVVVPLLNKPDVEEMEQEIIGDMEIVFADTMKKVLETAIYKEKDDYKKSKS